MTLSLYDKWLNCHPDVGSRRNGKHIGPQLLGLPAPAVPLDADRGTAVIDDIHNPKLAPLSHRPISIGRFGLKTKAVQRRSLHHREAAAPAIGKVVVAAIVDAEHVKVAGDH